MWFDLTLEARDGSRHQARYNPHTSDCEGLPLAVDPGIFAPVPRVAKDKPLGKSRAPRIRLGNFGAIFKGRSLRTE